jgi:Fumarylacetoacetase N-terminal
MGAWIDTIIPEDSDFTIDNLPWGVYTDENTAGRICVAIGNHVVDVHAWAGSWADDMGFGEEFLPRVKDALLQVSCFKKFLFAAGSLGRMKL